MKLCRYLVAYTLIECVGLLAAPPVGITSPSARVATIEAASRLLKPSILAEPLSSAVNPFTLSGSRSADGGSGGHQTEALAVVMASHKSLLAALADRLDPKGTFIVGGDAIILIGQKKLKVGDKLPISFEGAIYELEITSIETTRFSVRFKNEEITRPIVINKPAK